MSSSNKHRIDLSILLGTIFSFLLFSSLLSPVTADVDGSMIGVSNGDEFTFTLHTYQVKLTSDSVVIDTNVFNLTDTISVVQGEQLTLKIVNATPELAGVDAPGRTEDMVVTGCQEGSYCIGVEWSSGTSSEAGELGIGNSVGNEDHFVASTDWGNQKIKKEAEIAYTADNVDADGGSFIGTYDDSGDSVIINLTASLSGSDSEGNFSVTQSGEQHYDKVTGVLQHFAFYDTTAFSNADGTGVFIKKMVITQVGYSVPDDVTTETSSTSEKSSSTSETSSTSESNDEGFLDAPLFVGLLSIGILVMIHKRKY